MLPNAPSERIPNGISERFRTPFRTVPRTHPIPKGISGAATQAAAPDLIAMVGAMDPAEQAIAAKVLDACSRPLTAREIEGLLRQQGVTKTRATKLAGALKGFAIIAVVGPENSETENRNSDARGDSKTSKISARTPPPSRKNNTIKDARSC